MSGTQDANLAVNDVSKDLQSEQSGVAQKQEDIEEVTEEKLSPSQKMDKLIRGNSSNYLKKEIEKLRKEAAKYRSISKIEAAQKLELQKMSEEIKKELDSLKESNRNLKIMRALDKAGCIKSDLVSKEVPIDCENLEEFIERYKEDNKFLFSAQKKNVGSTFKASGAKNLTPSQQMDAYIRAALGR